MRSLSSWLFRFLSFPTPRQKKRFDARNGLEFAKLEPRQLLAVTGFASYDGVGNNVDDPLLGAAGHQLDRIAPTDYSDGLSEPARADAANARDISDLLSAQNGSVVNDRFVTSMWFQWGQFLDHDITRVFDVEPFEHTSEVTSLDISDDFPFERSPYDPSTGTDSPREHINHVSSFIDGSVVYGSSEAHVTGLRTLSGGLMRTSSSANGDLLPLNTDGLLNVPAFAPNFFVAGDVRANENIGLTAMQTLWVREHNRIATELATEEYAGMDLSDADVDEEIFQRARQIVTGLIQHITYNEFLPSTIGFNGVGTYSGYDPGVNPEISNEFSTAVFRIGHTALADELLIGDDGTSVALADAFFRPDFVQQHGIEGVLEGLTIQEMQEVDTLIVDGVRNFLDDGPGFDLAAINIQRGRDHGLPGFNAMREAIGLAPIDDFDELTSNEELAQKFRDLYGSPDEADPWIAMIAEDHVPGTMTGETMLAYTIDQFDRLRTGDRFWFENALDQDLIDEIRATRLSDVIERNTGLDVQDEVFWTRDTLVFRNGLDNEWLIRDFGENGGAEVVFFGEPGIRDPDNRVETVPVQRDEPINAIIVAGTNELGDGFFIPNALVSSPLADLGVDEFIITADVEFFEGYGLGGNDRWVFEGSIDSIFASGDAGRDVLKAETSASGSKVAFDSGAGHDSILIRSNGADSTVANGGAGRDRIRVRSDHAEMVKVDSGAGHDRVRVVADEANLVSVEGGTGNDRLVVRARHAQDVFVRGESGRDHVQVKASYANLVLVDGGRAADVVRVEAMRANEIFVNGSSGSDRIRVDARRAKFVGIHGGRGNDRIYLRVDPSVEYQVGGGKGFDRIRIEGDHNHHDHHRRTGRRHERHDRMANGNFGDRLNRLRDLAFSMHV